MWRPRPESNRGARICSPLRNHSATWPIRPAPLGRTGNAPCNIWIGDWKVRATQPHNDLAPPPRPRALSRFPAYSTKVAVSTLNLNLRGNDGRRRHAALEHGREPGLDERRDRPAHPAGDAPDPARTLRAGT